MPATMGPRDLRLRLRAAVAVGAASLAIRVLPYRLLRAAVGRWSRPAGTMSDVPVAALLRAVDSAAWRLPGTTCLSKAIAARILLAREGHASMVLLGVGRVPGSAGFAHAWIEGPSGPFPGADAGGGRLRLAVFPG